MFLVSAAAIGVFTITAISAIVTGPVKIEQYLDWPKPGTITCVRYRSPHVYNRDPEKLFRPEVGKTGMMKATNTLHSPGYANGAATKCVKKIDHEACDGVIDCRAAPGCEKLIVRYNQIVSAKMQGTTQEKTYSYFYVGASTKIVRIGREEFLVLKYADTHSTSPSPTSLAGSRATSHQHSDPRWLNRMETSLSKLLRQFDSNTRYDIF